MLCRPAAFVLFDLYMTEFRPQRFQVLPPVVKNLLIINILLAIFQFVLYRSTGINLADYLGLHYFRSDLFHSWQFVTHMFMHGTPSDLNLTLMHLFGNMFALWMFGSILENVWGPKRFLTFYFICGLGAAFCHMAVLSYDYESLRSAIAFFQQHPTQENLANLIEKQDLGHIAPFANLRSFWAANPDCSNCVTTAVDLSAQYYQMAINEATVGASGAVFGILFAFGYLFPNTLLYFFFLVPIKAKWVVAGYAVYELYSGMANNPGDMVAHFAHLGGMLFAYILLKIWNRRNRRQFF